MNRAQLRGYVPGARAIRVILTARRAGRHAWVPILRYFIESSTAVSRVMKNGMSVSAR
jgi:hypothetical protein